VLVLGHVCFIVSALHPNRELAEISHHPLQIRPAHRRQRRPLMISLKRTTVRVSKPSCPPTRKIPLRKQRM